MFFTLLDTGLSSVRVRRVFFAMQPLGDLRDSGHIGGGAVMNQS